jgi:hypothetical protein
MAGLRDSRVERAIHSAALRCPTRRGEANRAGNRQERHGNSLLNQAFDRTYLADHFCVIGREFCDFLLKSLQ